MERDNKVVLGAVLILLVGMLSFNFGSLTGNASKEPTSATVTASPSSIEFSAYGNEPNKLVSVKVAVHSGQIKSAVRFCKKSPNGGCVGLNGNSVAHACSTKTFCGVGSYEADTYPVNSNLPDGQYFFRAEAKRESTDEPQDFDSNLITVSHGERGYYDQGDTAFKY